MGANRTRFLANRRLQPLGHLSAVLVINSLACALSGTCWPIAGHALQHLHRRLQALHRLDYRGIEGFDVTLFSDVWMRMAQNPLPGLFIGPQRVQVGRNPATEPVPAVPLEPDGLDRRTNHPLRQLVHVHPFAVAMVEHDPGGGVVHGRAIRIKDRRQLGNHRNRLAARAGLGLVEQTPATPSDSPTAALSYSPAIPALAVRPRAARPGMR